MGRRAALGRRHARLRRRRRSAPRAPGRRATVGGGAAPRPGAMRAESAGGPVMLHPLHDSSATERVAWMDRVGIDHCLVNPGGYWQQLEFVRAPTGPRRSALQHLSVRAAVRLRPAAPGGGDDFGDLAAAVTELERARAAARVRSSSPPINGRPAGDRRPVIPHWTRCGTPRCASAWWRSSTSATPRLTSTVGPTSAGRMAAPASPGSCASPTPSESHAAQNLLVGDALRRGVRAPPRCSR